MIVPLTRTPDTPNHLRRLFAGPRLPPKFAVDAHKYMKAPTSELLWARLNFYSGVASVPHVLLLKLDVVLVWNH